jgi:hypothetical protein
MKDEWMRQKLGEVGCLELQDVEVQPDVEYRTSFSC